jgi:hypothetical protein
VLSSVNFVLSAASGRGGHPIDLLAVVVPATVVLVGAGALLRAELKASRRQNPLPPADSLSR